MNFSKRPTRSRCLPVLAKSSLSSTQFPTKAPSEALLLYPVKGSLELEANMWASKLSQLGGNARDAAEDVAREAQARGLQPTIICAKDFPVQQLPTQSLVLFFVSTTGQGEPPKNFKKFWNFLRRRSLPADSLKHVEFGVFGLGDSGYAKYNVMAKKLGNRLTGLGAKAIVEVGLGDDQHQGGYEAALGVWMDALWNVLGVHMSIPAKGLGESKFRVKMVKMESANGEARMEDAVHAGLCFRQMQGEMDESMTEGKNSCGFGPWKPHMAKVKTNTRITSIDHFQDTRHIELDLGSSGLEYTPGDLLAIFPKTSPSAISDLLNILGMCGSEWVEISPRKLPPLVDLPRFVCRVLDILQGVLDISGASPRRYFFEVMQHFATNPMEVERLAYFGSGEGRSDLHVYNQAEGRSVVDVLRDFPTCKPTLEWLLEVCPVKQPRQFSISSSQKIHPGEAHITVAVVEWKTPYRRTKKGLCTSWIADVHSTSDERVPVWIESGVFSPPKNPTTPMVLVGPGTGVAPFRAFLQDRMASGGQSGPSLLFFGCRSEASDYYYASEWFELQNHGILHAQHGLVVAFSRDRAAKVYVTHKLLEHATIVRDWILNRGAAIYVSGSAKKMPSEVMDAMVKVLELGGMTQDEAKALLASLERCGRYCVEAWS